ncbi:hypothetical protein [Stutzerimonas nitrititolerans]|uniref:hypothetical protein n=1 Tax=Stutzerimonas nitrititolerans TaxID=2482751 RepID=UPI0028A953A9|nr:hypothetical protein [Stutzerimonas nitrititolerans]
MKNLVLRPFESIADVGRKAHIALIAKTTEIAKCPQQKAIMMASASVTTLVLTVGSTTARAQGWGGMAETGAEQGDSIKESVGRVFAAVGFILAGLGGYNLWRKGKEGEQTRITGQQVLIPLLGGAALGATGYVLTTSGETVGIDGAAQGQIPQ